MKDTDKKNLLKILDLLLKDEVNSVTTKDYFKDNSKILDKKKIQSIIKSLEKSFD